MLPVVFIHVSVLLNPIVWFTSYSLHGIIVSTVFRQILPPKQQTASYHRDFSYHRDSFLSYLNNYLLVIKKHRNFSQSTASNVYSERFHSISHLVWWLKALTLKSKASWI